MKRLIYAVVALSALGLGAANIAHAGDQDEQSGQSVQAPQDEGAPSQTVKQSDEDKDKSETESDDGK
jgi:hypothetical protein